ncbi:MAG: ABC transporter ATP-binding protein [Rhodospirillaceae bacterium]|nr:ABC transporter ATP-binding protein [Rhodospirillaceae bacterium]
MIGLSGVRVARDHGRIVLDGIDLAVRPGERVGLVGPNGAGKSTLLHVIVGLLPVAAGQVAAFGRPCRTEREFAAVRRRVGLLFQDSDDQLFCPTVAEDIAFGPLNLGVGRAEAAAVVTRTLARVGLAGFEHRITYRLSGGEKRLVALATVLAMDPAVLLLDEPTTGLDQEAEERMLALLLSLDQAMVVVSHEPRVIDRLATRVVHLDRDGLKAA